MNIAKPIGGKPTQRASSKSARFFPWLYYAKDKDLGKREFPTQIHKIRDGLAVVEASQLFRDCGYEYAGSVLNVPADVKKHPGSRAREIELSLSSADVVFIPTRPPLDDGQLVEFDSRSGKPRKSRKPILKSGSDLESSIFEKLRLAFKTCKRGKIVLAEELTLASDAPSGADAYRAIRFQQYNGGTIERLLGKGGRTPKETNLAVGYLVSVSDVSPGGFRIVASFGAGGSETLWFNFLIRTAYRECFRQALKKNGVNVWMIPFLVPGWAPTFLTCDPHELQPRVECGRVIAWSLP